MHHFSAKLIEIEIAPYLNYNGAKGNLANWNNRYVTKIHALKIFFFKFTFLLLYLKFKLTTKVL